MQYVPLRMRSDQNDDSIHAQYAQPPHMHARNRWPFETLARVRCLTRSTISTMHAGQWPLMHHGCNCVSLLVNSALVACATGRQPED
jgi:hypothetical protein